MTVLMLQCKNCWRIFSSGINLGSGSTVILKGNKSQCPYCGSLENIPDGTFRGTVEGIVQILEKAENPIKKAKITPRTASNIKLISAFFIYKIKIKRIYKVYYKSQRSPSCTLS